MTVTRANNNSSKRMPSPRTKSKYKMVLSKHMQYCVRKANEARKRKEVLERAGDELSVAREPRSKKTRRIAKENTIKKIRRENEDSGKARRKVDRGVDVPDPEKRKKKKEVKKKKIMAKDPVEKAPSAKKKHRVIVTEESDDEEWLDPNSAGVENRTSKIDTRKSTVEKRGSKNDAQNSTLKSSEYPTTPSPKNTSPSILHKTSYVTFDDSPPVASKPPAPERNEEYPLQENEEQFYDSQQEDVDQEDVDPSYDDLFSNDINGENIGGDDSNLAGERQEDYGIKIGKEARVVKRGNKNCT